MHARVLSCLVATLTLITGCADPTPAILTQPTFPPLSTQPQTLSVRVGAVQSVQAGGGDGDYRWSACAPRQHAFLLPLGTSPTGEEVGVLSVGGRTASVKGVSVGQCAIRLHSANLLIDVSVNVVP
jgi:hypothetical protein